MMINKFRKTLTLLTLLICLTQITSGKISDKRLCADPKCSTLLSTAKTLLNYPSSGDQILSFPPNIEVKVFSKSAGTNKDLWGVEINGKRGYVPKQYLREERVLVKTSELYYEIPTEGKDEPVDVAPPTTETISESSGEATDPTPPTFEVFDGTMIPQPTINDETATGKNPDVAETTTEMNKSTDEIKPTVTEEKVVEVSTLSSVVEVTEPKPTEEKVLENSTKSAADDLKIADELKPTATEEKVEENSTVVAEVEIADEVILTAAEEKNVENSTLPSEIVEKEITDEIKPAETEEEAPTAVEVTDEVKPTVAEEKVVENSTQSSEAAGGIIENDKIEPSMTAIDELSNTTETLPSPQAVENEAATETAKTDTIESDLPKEIEVTTVLETTITEPEKIEVQPPITIIEMAQPDVLSSSLTVEEPTVQVQETAIPSVDAVADAPLNEIAEIIINEKLDLEETVKTEEKIEIATPGEEQQQTKSEEIVQPPPEILPIPTTPKPDKISVPDFLRNKNQGIDEKLPDVLPPPTIIDTITHKVEEEKPSQVEPVVDHSREELPLVQPPIVDDYETELDRILFPEKYAKKQEEGSSEMVKGIDTGYCDKELKDGCMEDTEPPRSEPRFEDNPIEMTTTEAPSFDEVFNTVINKAISMLDLIIYLLITSVSVVIFMLGYYCIKKSIKESPLINHVNALERQLMVSKKETALLQCELDEIRNKLASIENNSFGSNDMVIALRNQLDDTEREKVEYQSQIAVLEKELENAAEAGLELNRMVSDLLNNQNGSDSIINTVEELQKQLNEQQETILSINTLLAEKSRENSELHMLIDDQRQQFDEDANEISQSRDELQKSYDELKKQIDGIRADAKAKLEEQNVANDRLNLELSTVKSNNADLNKKYHASLARCQILDEYLEQSKKGSSSAELDDIFDIVGLKTDLLTLTKENSDCKEQLKSELEAKKYLEARVKTVGDEVLTLKQECSTAEKEKLEAETRLDVLSTYFKNKEAELQKELSVKEAMWMKSQGETTSTVDRIRTIQSEIQSLKSQNEALRAEIETQSSAYKVQLSTLDNRAHEAWLSTKQAERKLEESRQEATALRRRLTALAENSSLANGVDGIGRDFTIPSPMHLENPGSPIMGMIPPPFMAPPFIAPPPLPPHGFIPPPFMAPGEMRPPPLGRIISPGPGRYSPDDRDRYDGRYSPDSRYSPRRYNYDMMSQYDTETDYSPPPSPPSRNHGDRDNGRSFKAYSPSPDSKRQRGGVSSGSDSHPRRSGGGGGGGGGAGKKSNMNA